jgi:hypothetical protein
MFLTPQSAWVFAVYLTCDNKLMIQFKNRHRVPTVCCLYPAVPAEVYYELLLVWQSKGRFVWHQLPYKQPYKLVAPPVLPCLGCLTQLVVTSSLNPSAVGQAVTFTATITNLSGAAVPDAGNVEWFVDNVDVGPGTPLVVGPASASSTYTTSSLTAGSRAVKALFTGARGWQNCQGSMVQVVGSTAHVPCCPNVNLPSTLHASILPDPVASCGCLACTIPLTFDANTQHWTGSLLCACGGIWSVDLSCQIPFVNLVFNCTLLYNAASAMRLPQSASCSPISYQALWAVPNACAQVPGVSTGTLVITQ